MVDDAVFSSGAPEDWTATPGDAPSSDPLAFNVWTAAVFWEANPTERVERMSDDERAALSDFVIAVKSGDVEGMDAAAERLQTVNLSTLVTWLLGILNQSLKDMFQQKLPSDAQLQALAERAVVGCGGPFPDLTPDTVVEVSRWALGAQKELSPTHGRHMLSAACVMTARIMTMHREHAAAEVTALLDRMQKELDEGLG